MKEEYSIEKIKMLLDEAIKVIGDLCSYAEQLEQDLNELKSSLEVAQAKVIRLPLKHEVQ